MAGLRRGKVCAIPYLPQKTRQIWGTPRGEYLAFFYARGQGGGENVRRFAEIKAMEAIWRSVIQ